MFEQKRDELHGLMVFLASLSHGLEQVLGRGAKSVVYRAGKGVGAKCDPKEKTTDPLRAVAIVQEELQRKGVAWQVEPWKPASEKDFVYEKEGRLAMKVVCRNCIIRCSLFRYSHEQQQSLCNLNQGEFCGIYQKITGKQANLDIIHAGENACLKELSWSK
jgi:predicted hydrocarbon binding protein